MRFHWTTETDPDDKTMYALRDGKNNVCAWITKAADGFYGTVIDRGLPDSGPYKARASAADWIETMLVKLNPRWQGAQFEEFPT